MSFKCVKQRLSELKSEIDKVTIKVIDFNTSLPIINRVGTQKISVLTDFTHEYKRLE